MVLNRNLFRPDLIRGSLADEMVLLGGCATGLLISDPAASTIRATRDVDTIVDVSSRADYYQLVEKLKQRHFKEDTSAIRDRHFQRSFGFLKN
jgi:hypothetical protein